MRADLDALAKVMIPMSDERARQLSRAELPRITCPECGNSYYPHERPRDCLIEMCPNRTQAHASSAE